MPQGIALKMYKGWQAKRISDPELERKIIYKHLLWDVFSGRMIMDEELERMAERAESLYELTILAVEQLKPQFQDRDLNATLKAELKRYFEINMPDALK